tara:strand:+ start:581 stop:901 length:321 start_codon:yes stop_codon:yes gene_type:complete
MINLLFILNSFFFINTSDESNVNDYLIEENLTQQAYSVIGVTRKGYGQEYSINLRVTATCYGNSCTISKVQVAGSYGYSSVRWNIDYGRSDSYYVSYNGETYYFSF